MMLDWRGRNLNLHAFLILRNAAEPPALSVGGGPRFGGARTSTRPTTANILHFTIDTTRFDRSLVLQQGYTELFSYPYYN